MDVTLEKLNRDCSFRDIVIGGLLDLSVGDAFGVPVEFMSRTEVRAINLQEMEGNDTEPGFWSTWTDKIPQGAWSDDTSMTIAAMYGKEEIPERWLNVLKKKSELIRIGEQFAECI